MSGQNGESHAEVGSWLLRIEPRGGAGDSEGVLVCVPPAGGWAQQFTSWTELFPTLTLLAVRMPGRGWRLREAPAASLREAATGIAGACAPQLRVPYAVFGHSFGSLLGYEVARELVRAGAGAPRLLCVSAGAAPHLLPGALATLAAAPGARAAALLAELGAVPAAVRASGASLARAAGALRQDLALLAAYRPGPSATRGDFPIHAFIAGEDALVGREQMLAWERYASAFSHTEVPGGHRALLEDPGPLRPVIARALAAPG